MEKKISWFSLFRKMVPADYEQWMEELALEGWNVEHIGQFSCFRMTFYKTEPKKYRYVFDLNAFHKSDYRAMYEQFGWEYVGEMGSLFVWRMEYTDVKPESFSDRESIIRRNKRVRFIVAVVLALLLLGIAALVVGIILSASRGLVENVIEHSAELLLYAVLAVYAGWVIRSISRNIER